MRQIKYLIAALLIFLVCSGFMFIGGRPPSGGTTYILGDDTEYSGTTALFQNGNAQSRRYGMTASASVNSGSDIVVGVHVNSTNSGENMKVYICDSGGNAISDITSTSITQGWIESTVTLSSGIVSGNTYYPVAVADGYWGISHNESGFDTIQDSSGSYSTPPDPIDTDAGAGYGYWGLYARLP